MARSKILKCTCDRKGCTSTKEFEFFDHANIDRKLSLLQKQGWVFTYVTNQKDETKSDFCCDACMLSFIEEM